MRGTAVLRHRELDYRRMGIAGRADRDPQRVARHGQHRQLAIPLRPCGRLSRRRRMAARTRVAPFTDIPLVIGAGAWIGAGASGGAGSVTT